MPELTLESLAARVAALERQLAEQKSPAAGANDWRRVVGMFDSDPGFLDVLREAEAIREADRAAARAETAE